MYVKDDLVSKLFIWCFIFISRSLLAFQYPAVDLFFNRIPPSTVFYGEVLKIPVQLNFWNLIKNKFWYVPSGTTLEVVAGNCPLIPLDTRSLGAGTCYVNLIIPGSSLGKVISGSVTYHVYGETGFPAHRWNNVYLTPAFNITVIPHYLSMSPMARQQATVQHEFYYNLKNSVRYYDENARAGNPAQGVILPAEQNGLYFDPVHFALVGKPKHLGTYTFKVAAKNSYGMTQSSDLSIEVTPDPKDKPVFRANYPVASAIPKRAYDFNLMNLLEHHDEFMQSNQITFELLSAPSWLAIDKEDKIHLKGFVPADLAVQEEEVRLIASSNTGGNSDAFTLKIPMTYDASKKPSISDFELNQEAEKEFYENVSRHIKNPEEDSNLKLIIDKVEPSAPWLYASSTEPTVLTGNVPKDAVGKKFYITLRAATLIGGSSEPVTIPLQIAVDKTLTPKFKKESPAFPRIYSGQSFFYDFVANKDIVPEFEEAPYKIELTKNAGNPLWLRIENNTLIAESIPKEIDPIVELHVTVSNVPGGESSPYLLILYAN